MPTVIAILMAIVFIFGLLVGNTKGQDRLCQDQFKGEMHDGKCVKVQREEVK